MKHAKLLALLLIPACSMGDGNLSLRLDGEAGAREGLPNTHAHGGDTHAHSEFEDGWQVNFDRYLVSVRGIEIARSGGEVGFASEGAYIYDLSRDIPEIELINLESQRWDRFGFEIAPPMQAESLWLGDEVTDADAQLMMQSGATHFIEGHAHHPETGRFRSFTFLIDAPVAATECTNGTDGTDGVIVRKGSTEDVLITFHPDYLFTSTLSDKGSGLRFEPMAAMADANDHIEFAALEQQPLADLHGADGQPLLTEDGAPIFYDPGGVAIPGTSLAHFVREAVRAQPHLNGEGLCRLDLL
jgi:hypothetical protein